MRSGCVNLSCVAFRMCTRATITRSDHHVPWDSTSSEERDDRRDDLASRFLHQPMTGALDHGAGHIGRDQLRLLDEMAIRSEARAENLKCGRFSPSTKILPSAVDFRASGILKSPLGVLVSIVYFFVHIKPDRIEESPRPREP
jgi:hypothetical protein